MIKDIPMKTMVGLLLTVIIGMLGYYLPHLDSRIDKLSSKIDEVSKKVTETEVKIAYTLGIINTTLPKINLLTAVSISSSKGIPIQDFVKAIPLFQQDPIQAKKYLENQLNFSPKEINSVIRSGDTPN